MTAMEGGSSLSKRVYASFQTQMLPGLGGGRAWTALVTLGTPPSSQAVSFVLTNVVKGSGSAGRPFPEAQPSPLLSRQ